MKINTSIKVIFTIALAILLTSISLTLSAQIDYSYDAGGNRYLRSISAPMMKPSNTDNTADLTANKLAAKYGISVQPNPSRYAVTVNIKTLADESMGSAVVAADSDKSAEIYVLDLNGKILYTKQLKTIQEPVQLDISSYALGVYFVKVLIDKKDQLFYRVIKQ